MKKLKKLLSVQAKDERHRRHQINIHVAILGWVAEFSGFFIVMLGSFILGHGSVVVTLTLQTISNFMLFIAVPSVYLISSNTMKARIAESKNYFNFLKFFKLEKNNLVEVDEEENSKHSDETDDA